MRHARQTRHSGHTQRRRARRGEGDRLREEILEATEELLAETADRKAVSIRAVADAVGVTAPSIYRHFADKQVLLFAVCTRHFDELLAELREVSAHEDDPREALQAVGDAYLDWGLAHPEEYRIMFMTRPETGEVPEDYSESIGPDSAFGLLMTLVQRCIESGVIDRPESEVFEVSYGLFALVHGVTSQALANDARFFPPTDSHAALDLMMGAVLGGLGPRSGPG